MSTILAVELWYWAVQLWHIGHSAHEGHGPLCKRCSRSLRPDKYGPHALSNALRLAWMYRHILEAKDA